MLCATGHDSGRTPDRPHRLRKGYALLASFASRALAGALPLAQQRRRLSAGEFLDGGLEALPDLGIEIEPLLLRQPPERSNLLLVGGRRIGRTRGNGAIVSVCAACSRCVCLTFLGNLFQTVDEALACPLVIVTRSTWCSWA